MASDASLAASKLAAWGAAAVPAFPTAYAELDPEAQPLPASPLAGQAGEAAKRARYAGSSSRKVPGGGAAGGAASAVQLQMLSPLRLGGKRAEGL